MEMLNKCSVGNAEHYTWGGVSDGWHLLKQEQLSVIEERMPPGASEQLHFHSTARQFFYVLNGQADFESEGRILQVSAGEGLHVPPEIPHRILNNSAADIRFLVISSPRSHGDRVNL